jgi:hypothetical protein
MNEHPEIDIHALRQIGWDHWDPIGIRRRDDSAWRNEAADEYDAYLLHAATMILQVATSEAVAAYLDEMISDHMALGPETRMFIALPCGRSKRSRPIYRSIEKVI